VIGGIPPAVSTRYISKSLMLGYSALDSNCNQSTAPVPNGPLFAVNGALMSPVLVLYKILSTLVRLKIGVPELLKK
jgi:hypothetical protein